MSLEYFFFFFFAARTCLTSPIEWEINGFGFHDVNTYKSE